MSWWFRTTLSRVSVGSLPTRTAIFLLQIKGNSQILRLYQCRLQICLFKVYPQSKPSYVVAESSNLSQFPIQVRFTHQSTANHWAAFIRKYNIIRNMMYSLIVFLPWMFDGARDDTKFSVIFVS